MSRADTARKHYEAARAEIILRIQLRDTVLLAYLAATTTAFGVALGTSPSKPQILWLVPFLSLGAATLIAQHHEVIGSLQHFLAAELEPAYSTEESAPQWNASATFRKYSHRQIAWRLLAHCVLFLIPAYLGWYLYFHQGQGGIAPWSCCSFVYTAVGLSSFVVLVASDLHRRRLYKLLEPSSNEGLIGDEGRREDKVENANEANDKILTLYQTLTQQWVHAQQVRWTLLYNFLVASTVFLLAWVTLFSAQNNVKYKGILLVIICSVGIIKCVLWFYLGRRGNEFVGMFDRMGQRIEDSFASSLPRPFQESEALRSSLKGGAGIPARRVFNLLPLLFLVLYLVLFIVSLIFAYRSV